MRVSLEVNGVQHVRDVEPRMLLTDLLRHELHLTGTHVGCEQGVCGACTVHVDGVAVRACLVMAAQVDGARIRTVEGLAQGQPEGRMHVLQEAFKESHGLQCGFCTPGILMSLEPLLADPEALADDHRIRAALSGNLCRCTGYAHIVDAVRLTVSRLAAEDPAADSREETP